jgi:hypothetical protein
MVAMEGRGDKFAGIGRKWDVGYIGRGTKR